MDVSSALLDLESEIFFKSGLWDMAQAPEKT